MNTSFLQHCARRASALLLALSALCAGAPAFAQSAAITATSPASLNQGNLRRATLTVTLTSATYASGAAVSHFTLTTAVPGLTVYSVAFNSGRTAATVRLHYDGSDFNTAATIAVTAAAAGTSHSAALTTGTVAVGVARWVNVSKKSIALEEGGSANTYTVALESPPTSNVTVTVTSDHTAAVTAAPGTLTFTTTNWAAPQTVTVTPVDDNSDTVDEVALVTNVATGGGYSASDVASRTVRVTVADDDTRTGTDYDTDDDGLIEISGHAQLNAIRWDLDGDGSSMNAGYSTAFSSPAANMGCPDGSDNNSAGECKGYELTANIDLDTDGDGSFDSGDAYWRSGAGWDPIGEQRKKSTSAFTATLRGNGHTISNLYRRERQSTIYEGDALFDVVRGARIESLGILKVDNGDGAGGGGGSPYSTTSPDGYPGTITGHLENSTLAGVYASGQITMDSDLLVRAGGLAGRCTGSTIVASYADVSLTTGRVHGGLIGDNSRVSYDANENSVWGGCSVLSAYATGALGSVTGTGNSLGGLVGRNEDSQATAATDDSYWDRQTTGRTTSHNSPNANGKTTAELQAPAGYAGIYQQWDDYDVDGDGRVTADDDAWDFGQANQYPVLKWRGLATSPQFTFQLAGQTDTAPTYGATTVPNKTYTFGEAIEPFQIPQPTGGNGTYDYTVTGLPGGLVFDEDGSGTCMAVRTVCGTPTAAGDFTITVAVADSDTNVQNSDRATLTFSITVRATIVVSPSSLSLNEGGSATYTVVLGTSATASVTATSDNPHVAIDTDATPLTLTLAFDPTNWNTPQTVTVRGLADGDAVDEAATISHAATGLDTVNVRASVDDDEATGTDYDADNDGLIDVSTLAQLNAIRWDVDGDGTASAGNTASYAAAFGNPTAGMGCPDGSDADQLPDACTGYALAADLDFDTDDDGDVDADDTGSFPNWTPIPAYAAVFDGKGRTISNLTMDGGAAVDDFGFFSTTAAASTIRNLGLVDVNLTGGRARAGALAGSLSGRVEAVYVTGFVSGDFAVGGLAGLANATSAVVASYSAADVRCLRAETWAGAGGFISYNTGSIAASYSTGTVTGACLGTLAGFASLAGSGSATASYWDTGLSGIADDSDSAMPEGLSSAEMWTPTAYGGVYADWDDQDIDNDGATDADPWDFGILYQHPVLRHGGHDPAGQRTDYDDDDDGLIEISTLRQLDAVRWDLDGDGGVAAGNLANYIGAFFNPVLNASGVGFCPTNNDDPNDNDCTGYELLKNLDFDTDGDGSTHTNGTSDAGDAYHNGGAGWVPIGPGHSTAPGTETHFRATFDGNGRVIKNLYLNQNRNYSGLFGALSDAAHVTSLGLEDARVQQGQGSVAALAGVNRGRVSAVWVSGSVRANGGNVGGLIGAAQSPSAVVASYSTAAVECLFTGSRETAGLVGSNGSGAAIRSSYSIGAVTGQCGSKGGLTVNYGTVESSYWDAGLSGIADDADGDPPEGLSTANLQTPTSYNDTVTHGTTTLAVFADWDDQDVDGDGSTSDGDDADPWDFGLANTFPILKYRELAATPQLDAQPDTAPDFGTSTVANMAFQKDQPIQQFQVPRAAAGNGLVTYTQTGLPAGLVFDADGAGSCAGATPRAICGTPTATTTAPVTVTITARDADSNMAPADEDRLTFTVEVVVPSAAISNPTVLGEAALNNAAVTVRLTNATFESGLGAGSFTLTTSPPLSGLRVASIGLVRQGDTSATLELGYSRDNFDNTVRTFTVTVADSAHSRVGALTTPAINIVPAASVVLSGNTLSLAEGGSDGTYTVALGGQPTGTVTVTANTSDAAAVTADTSAANGIQTTLTFDAATWNTPQTVTVAAVDDDDAADETVTIGHSVANYGIANGPDVTVNVDDDETAGIVLDADPSTPAVVDAGPVALREDAMHADNTASYGVRLMSEPTGAVTVTIASANANLVTVGDTDGVTPGTQHTLSFSTTNWDTLQTVSLTAAQDEDPNDEQVAIRHAAQGGGYDDEQATITAAVTDDDVGVIVDTDPNAAGDQHGTLALREGGSRTYAARLSTLPAGGNVTVTVSSDNPQITVNPSSLTFTTGNWNTARTVTVRGAQDGDAVGEWGDIDNEANGGQYNGETTAIRATAEDDEARGRDYDADGDFLIEISSLAQLNAVRWDLDGDGAATSSNLAAYRAAFAGSVAEESMGCLDGPDLNQEGDCKGYELTADLDFDTDGDGDVDADDPNSHANWQPIGGIYTATFDGNGHRVSNLAIDRSESALGLFTALGGGGVVRSLGVVDASVRGGGLSNPAIGVLVGAVQSGGRVAASYALGGTVTVTSASDVAGGLAGRNSGAIVASYSTAAVDGGALASVEVGGLVGQLNNGTVSASYADGAVTATGSGVRAGGLVGAAYGASAAVAASYCGLGTGQTSCVGALLSSATGISVTRLTASAMQRPTTYGTSTDAFAAWDDQDVDGDGEVDEADADPWDFGSAHNHPALKYGGLDVDAQRNDYDEDGDGLIEISSLAQLNAVRWDLNGDGAPVASATSSYFAAGAFFNGVFEAAGLGLRCPASGADADDNDCLGYELAANLDFDTDDDNDVDSNDAYPNWTPIGAYSATFEGNNRTITRLTTAATGSNDRGLFLALASGSAVRGLGLVDVNVTSSGNGEIGALAGTSAGAIEACYVLGGTVSISTSSSGGVAGGLVGVSDGLVKASFSTAAVSASSNLSPYAGGLVGSLEAGRVIAASYATGPVSAAASGSFGRARSGGLVGFADNRAELVNSYSIGAVSATGNSPRVGGLVGDASSNATFAASYWDTQTSGQATSDGGVGQSTSDLKTPTEYAGIYAAWDTYDTDGSGVVDAADDAWDFLTSNDYPVLRYRGLPEAAQLGAQPDTAPAFPSATSTNRTLPGNLAIEAFEVPAATGGNGVLSYAATSTPPGVSFGRPQCATERTFCGTPTTAGVYSVVVTVTDGDSNMAPGDQGMLTFTLTVPSPSLAIATTTPDPLVEAGLNGARVDLELAGSAFAARLAPSHFALTTAPPVAGLSVGSVRRVSDTEAILTLRFDRTDFTAQSTLRVRVLAAGHRFGGDMDTGTVAVMPSTGLLLSATMLALEEAPGSTNANVGTYTVALTGQPPGAVTVTPTSGNSDVTTSGALSFSAATWDTPQTVTVTAGQDDDAADDLAQIAHPVTGIPGVRSGPRVRVTVSDDDTPGLTLATSTLAGGVTEGASGTYTVRLATQPTGPVVVTVTSDEAAVSVDVDATAGGDQNTLLFHAVNWDTPQTVTVLAGEDDDGESETVTLTHDAAGADYGAVADAGVSFMVTDNDAKGLTLSTGGASLLVQENGSSQYTLALDTEPAGGNVRVAVASNAATIATANPAMLTFTAENWNLPQTVTVSGLDDANTTVELAQISHTPTGADYDGVSAVSQGVQVGDDDAAGLKVSPTSLAVAEGGAATYAVRLNIAPTAAVTVTVTSGEAAKLTADTDPNTGGAQTTLSFDSTNWATVQTVRVAAAADADGAGETVLVSHAVVGTGDYASLGLVQRPGVGVRVRDAQTAGLVLEPESLTIGEGGTATYAVRFSAPPASGTSTVSIASAGAAGLTTDASTLLFDGSNWNTAQTVTVTAEADHARLTDAEAALTHGVTGYGAVTAGPALPVTVRNTTLDYDEDADGLLEVASLAQLNAMRWDLEGDGTPVATATSSYAAAFPNARGGGCPSAITGVSCDGYELAADLDFDTDGDGATHRNGVGDDGDDYYNGGAGWEPIGHNTSNPYSGRFDGNGHVLGNLFVNAAGNYPGLFGVVTGRFAALGLANVQVRGVHNAGALAGFASGTARLTGVWSTGAVSGATAAGGLVGRTSNGLRIEASYSTAAVECRNAAPGAPAGGLAGGDGTITLATSWAAGAVTGDCPEKGGLAGLNATVEASYWDAAATGIADDADPPRGLSTADLRRPTGYEGIYENWNIDLDGDYAPDDPWDFGTSQQYPSLKWGGHDPARQFAVPAPPVPDGGGGAPPPVNLPPEAASALADATLELEETLELDLGGAFRDPEGGLLIYGASSSNPGLASVSVRGNLLRIEAKAPGAARVTVSATDSGGLSAAQSFIVWVGVAISFAGDASAPEGGMIRLELVANRPPRQDLSVAYVLSAGGDPASAADDSDHDGGDGGTALLPAGATRAEIAIGILDDDLIEPLREFFTVSLSAPDADAGYGLGLRPTATATIEEGVCDRAAPVRDALRGRGDCASVADLSSLLVLNLSGRGLEGLRTEDFPGLSGLRVLDLSNNRLSDWPSEVLGGFGQLISLRLGGNRLAELPADALSAHPRLLELDLAGNELAGLPSGAFRGLGALRRLDLSGNLLAALPGDVFAGLSGLRWLRLNGNRLEVLPAGLFAGIGGLEELQLQGNPGAPFVLTLELARTDGEPWSAGPAMVSARVAEGAPFAMRSVLKASAGALPEAGVALGIPAGAVSGDPATVEQGAASLVLARLEGAPPVPDDECELEEDLYLPCFQGIATAVGSPLALFKRPPGAPAPIMDRTLRAGDKALRLALSDWFEAAAGETLSYAAESSDPSAVRVRVEDGELILMPLEEGTALVTLTATDSDGLSATVRFEVQVTRASRTHWRGWRLILLEPDSSGA